MEEEVLAGRWLDGGGETPPPFVVAGNPAVPMNASAWTW